MKRENVKTVAEILSCSHPCNNVIVSNEHRWMYLYILLNHHFINTLRTATCFNHYTVIFREYNGSFIVFPNFTTGNSLC